MKKKVLFVVNSLRLGGTERVVSILTRHLKDDIEIHLALYNNVIDFPVPEGVKIFHLNQPTDESYAAMLMKLPVTSFKLHRYCKKEGIVSVCGFLNRGLYICALLRVLWGYKGYIIMCKRSHQTNLMKYTSAHVRRVNNLLLRWSLPKADLVLANSKGIASDLRKNYFPKGNLLYLPNPVDFDQIVRLSNETVDFPFSNDHFTFIAVGGLRSEKNYPGLLKAFSLVQSPHARLILVGGGDKLESLKAESIALNISHRVYFTGHCCNPFPLLRNSKCLVLNSFVEGFPNSILEALVLGKPVISTDCLSGPREILSADAEPQSHPDGYLIAAHGVLVPVNNPAVMAKAMNRLMVDQSLRSKWEDSAAAYGAGFHIKHLRERYLNVFAGTPELQNQ